MVTQDFLTKVEGTEYLEVLKENEQAFIVLNRNTSKKYEVRKDSLIASDWENVNSVFCGREPIILDGITRIVGYFSKISNWNKSKLGELKDRRQGNYRVNQ